MNNCTGQSKAINTMTDREAMGLLSYFEPSVLDDLTDVFAKYKEYSVQELILIAESKQNTVKERFVGAQLLGLHGDSRIKTAEPIMISIPSAQVKIGLPITKVDAIVKQYNKFGVIRDWIMKETPEFSVYVPEFKIAKYLVTNQEYKEFLLETNFQELPTSWAFGIYPIDKANHPVYTVSEQAAERYVQWLSQKTLRNFRLPKEVEWEYAAGGIEHFEYPWGNDYQPDRANTVEEKIYRTTPVGIFPNGDSPFGVSDMAGNVEEYTADVYQPYPGGETITDDLGIQGDYRVTRGGSFSRYSDLTRTKRRHGYYPKAIYCIGFRVAENV